MSKAYELVIVGGGTSGASLLYTLAEFTDIDRVALIEKEDEIERSKGFGGVRPQIVDTAERSLDMGEAKLTGDGIIFNVTPSPGASTCLKNAMRDARQLVEFFDGDCEFDEAAFREATIGNFPRTSKQKVIAD
jgi:L-2-hydroxyglutarate oxidase LhgO